MMSSEPEGSSSGRRLYIRYGMVCLTCWNYNKGSYKISKYKIFELFKYIDMNIKYYS